MTDQTDLEQRAINVIRGLAMDGPEAARSGHQGTAMALAPLAHVLWTRVMNYDASEPDWPDRDRFVLSAGHASILLYSMLHLTGFGLTIDDLRHFRQWGSLTPGHPEAGHTVGVEVTTGPLGQGVANGVGLGLAERVLRARFGPEVVDHHTFVICGDGDLEEGISHEAASLAGHLGLGRLVYVYDDNHVSIDGPTELALSDDPVGRFEAYGWDVDDVGEAANDLDVLEAALERAKSVTDKPSLIVLRSHIGYPSPKFTDNPKAHGNPFDADEIRRTKEVMGLPPDEDFFVPADVLELYRAAGARGAEVREAWQGRFERWTGDREAWSAGWAGTGVDGWDAKLPHFEPGGELATRQASAKVLNALVDVVPGLHRRLRRPHRQHRRAARQRRDAGRRHTRWAPDPLRHPRARHGRDHERHRQARRAAPRRRHLLRVQRLHPPLGPPRGARAGARHLLLHPRLRRGGRGRPHAPAGRAPRVAARHARPARHPARRRQRDGGGLEAGRRAPGPHRPGPLAPEPARPRGHRRPRRRGAGRLRARRDRRHRRRRPRRHPHRHRLRGLPLRRRRRAPRCRRHPRAGRLDAVLGALRRADRARPGRGPALRGPHARGRGGGVVRLGPLGRRHGRRSTASVRPHPPRSCSSSSASTRRTSPSARRTCWPTSPPTSTEPPLPGGTR